MESNETEELKNGRTEERKNVRMFMRLYVYSSRVVMIAAAVLFFLVTSYFSFQLRSPYSGPDETAQAFFIQHYAATGTLRAAEPLNAFVEDIVHPRSMYVAQHDLAPGTFIGIILIYGWLAWIFGLWIIPFLTPLFAIIGAIAFYLLIRTLFSDRVAWWSFILLLVYPAWVYYTARSLFSANVFFLSVLMLGTVLLVRKHMHWWSWPIAGLLVGASLITRTTEAVWVFGFFFLFAMYYRRDIQARFIFLFLLFAILPFLPVFYHQSLIFGHPLATGYAQGNGSFLPTVLPWKFSSPILATIAASILPFGFHFEVIFSNVRDYLLIFVWWFTIPTLLGIVIALRRPERNVKVFLWFFGVLVLWLILYYGSYVFRDSILPSPTIGTSYVRYWLPIYVFGIPFAVLVIQAITRHWIRVTAFGAIIVFSLSLTFFTTQESLWWMATRTRDQKLFVQQILAIVPLEAVILTEKSDKLFFPERKVIYYDARGQLQVERLLARVLKEVPVYYYSGLTPTSINFLNTHRLAQYGVAWEDGMKIGDLTLYRLQKE